VETDNAADLLDGSGKFFPLNEFQIYPVVDIADWVRAAMLDNNFTQP